MIYLQYVPFTMQVPCQRSNQSIICALVHVHVHVADVKIDGMSKSNVNPLLSQDTDQKRHEAGGVTTRTGLPSLDMSMTNTTPGLPLPPHSILGDLLLFWSGSCSANTLSSTKGPNLSGHFFVFNSFVIGPCASWTRLCRPAGILLSFPSTVSVNYCSVV